MKDLFDNNVKKWKIEETVDVVFGWECGDPNMI